MIFDPPISTSNLVQPNRADLMRYARAAFEGEPVVEWLESRLAAFHETGFCVAVCNGFWGLVLAISALAIPGRSDLLMPSLTYRRMADVAAWCKLRPRFCEVDQASLACTAATMRPAITPDVGLLLGVHPIVGQCDVVGLQALAAEQGLPLLFDSVESVYERAAPGKIGGFGAAECFSLHASKLLNGFEGGYITTNDIALARRLKEARDGQGSMGLDARLNSLHAAMALAGLDDLPDQVRRNQLRFQAYEHHLRSVRGLRLLPFDPASSYKTVVVELTDEWTLSRAETLERLNRAQVLARAYYHPPLHAKPMAYPFVPATLPGTDRLAERFMLLPCGHHVDLADIAAVADMLLQMSRPARAQAA